MDTGHGTQPRHSIQTRCRPVVVLSIDVCSHHYISFIKVLHNADSVRSCIIILENESTAAIPKAITTGYNDKPTLSEWPPGFRRSR